MTEHTKKKERRQRSGTDRVPVQPDLRKVMREVLLENATQSARISAELATKFCRDNLGMTPEAHKLDHLLFSPMIPWLKAKQEREEWLAALLRKVLTDNAQRLASWGFWFVLLAFALGATGAWTYLVNAWEKLLP